MTLLEMMRGVHQSQNIPLSERDIWAVCLKNCVEMSETVVGWVRLTISNV